MTELLVSVRSVTEAEAALEGGADLIDVKEPRNGALGRASVDVVRDVCKFVAHRRPVSAALGELRNAESVFVCDGLKFLKWGLAGCLHLSNWQEKLEQTGEEWCARMPDCRPVAVAYADWEQAKSPAPEQVLAFARERRWGAFLLDTWTKNGETLLDWLPYESIREVREACAKAGLPIALAGALGADEIARLNVLKPDWFAVRGAACAYGARTGCVDAGRVRELVSAIRESTLES